MNAFEYSDLLPPLSLGVANLFFAGVLHRTIVRNSALLRRRHFFESLAVFAFVLAFILMVTGFALWRENPHFVLVCTGTWILICLVFTSILRHRNQRGDDELAVPDLWPSSSDTSGETSADAPDQRVSTPARPTDPPRRPAVPLDAFTRARLKRARRERSAGDGRVRDNRSVYAEKQPGSREHPDREEP